LTLGPTIKYVLAGLGPSEYKQKDRKILESLLRLVIVICKKHDETLKDWRFEIEEIFNAIKANGKV